ncbi:class I SAM-dependent methyltransferase [Acuticoccus sp. I52.16.1]|uniref:class I SAM-dependent methyltransferase n=1 Tax=Acuticoccus sp. I52.16.1 TaxID=2928472 RepID=UPI001FCFB8C1|nr:class I SAM-dependent methyltransferase [Acuticoccus sp. I52.16.1]UOM33842.1 class I SAM-dependent methyltransferase [Acuticoccus sp. I52.16.1]
MTPTNPPEIVADELTLIARLIPLDGARVLDVGCGGGTLTHALVEKAAAAEATGIDLADALPSSTDTPGVHFRAGSAEALPAQDASVDVVLMMKSLHHVPVPAMDKALEEIARVLVPGGMLYVSEPVARGPFDEIMRNFHDEAQVRAEAQAALARCRVLEPVQAFTFLSPVAFVDFADFERRMMHMPTLWRPLTPDMVTATRTTYDRLSAADGSFRADRENAVAVLRKPA